MPTQLDTQLSPHQEILTRLTNEAKSASGLVFQQFAARLKASIESYASNLSPAEKAQFLELATKEYRYSHLEEYIEMEGICSHGFDKDTCPCGCFEDDDAYYEDRETSYYDPWDGFIPEEYETQSFLDKAKTLAAKITFQHWRRTSKYRFKQWWKIDCCDCGKAETRFGRPAGNHLKCDPIPF